MLNKKNTNGATNKTLSSLSSIPPCPGIKLLKSLTPAYLFIVDAAKSPIWLIALNTIAIGIITVYDILKFK